MVIVHAENPQSHGKIHRQAAIAAVQAQRGGQVVGLRELSRGGQGQTCGPEQAGRESPQGSHPAAMLGQQRRERQGENGTGVMETGGGHTHTYTHETTTPQLMQPLMCTGIPELAIISNQ